MTPASQMEMALRPAQRARGGMTFYPLAALDGDDVRLMLGPVGTFPAHIPFEPSVIGGNGGEPRKSVRFAISNQEILDSLEELENKAQALLKGLGERYVWTSSMTPATEIYPASVKAKLWVSGERAVTVRDQHGNPIAMPKQPWPKPKTNAVLEARGVYRLANGNAGLILQATALQLAEGGRMEVEDPFQI